MKSLAFSLVLYFISTIEGQGVCPQGWQQILNETRCVYPMTPKNFSEISQMCAGLTFGAYPVKIRNTFENGKLRSVTADQLSGAAPWVSIWKKVTDKNWTYYDGATPEYTNWAAGEPSNTANRDLCAIMSPTTGLWKSSECNTPHPYFCSVEITSQCLPGWTYWNVTNSCYFLQNFTSLSNGYWKTWGPYDTEPACQAMNPKSHLVSIHSKAEDDFVYNLALTTDFIHTPHQYSPESDPCHYQGVSIGIYGNAVIGGKWTDGTTINYLGQNAGGSANWMMQNDPSCNEHTWHGHGETLVWCRFVCKMPPITPQTTP